MSSGRSVLKQLVLNDASGVETSIQSAHKMVIKLPPSQSEGLKIQAVDGQGVPTYTYLHADTTDGKLYFPQETHVDGPLNVSQASTFAGTANFSGVTTLGETNVTGPLSVSQASTFTGAVDFQGTVQFSGDASFGSFKATDNAIVVSVDSDTPSAYSGYLVERNSQDYIDVTAQLATDVTVGDVTAVSIDAAGIDTPVGILLQNLRDSQGRILITLGVGTGFATNVSALVTSISESGSPYIFTAVDTVNVSQAYLLGSNVQLTAQRYVGTLYERTTDTVIFGHFNSEPQAGLTDADTAANISRAASFKAASADLDGSLTVAKNLQIAGVSTLGGNVVVNNGALTVNDGIVSFMKGSIIKLGATIDDGLVVNTGTSTFNQAVTVAFGGLTVNDGLSTNTLTVTGGDATIDSGNLMMPKTSGDTNGFIYLGGVDEADSIRIANKTGELVFEKYNGTAYIEIGRFGSAEDVAP